MTTHGKHRKRKRGAHKSAGSPEVKRWNAEHLIPPPPPWLDRETYVQLAELRGKL